MVPAWGLDLKLADIVSVDLADIWRPWEPCQNMPCALPSGTLLVTLE